MESKHMRRQSCETPREISDSQLLDHKSLSEPLPATQNTIPTLNKSKVWNAQQKQSFSRHLIDTNYRSYKCGDSPDSKSLCFCHQSFV